MAKGLTAALVNRISLGEAAKKPFPGAAPLFKKKKEDEEPEDGEDDDEEEPEGDEKEKKGKKDAKEGVEMGPDPTKDAGGVEDPNAYREYDTQNPGVTNPGDIGAPGGPDDTGNAIDQNNYAAMEAEDDDEEDGEDDDDEEEPTEGEEHGPDPDKDAGKVVDQNTYAKMESHRRKITRENVTARDMIRVVAEGRTSPRKMARAFFEDDMDATFAPPPTPPPVDPAPAKPTAAFPAEDDDMDDEDDLLNGDLIPSDEPDDEDDLLV